MLSEFYQADLLLSCWKSLRAVSSTVHYKYVSRLEWYEKICRNSGAVVGQCELLGHERSAHGFLNFLNPQAVDALDVSSSLPQYKWVRKFIT